MTLEYAEYVVFHMNQTGRYWNFYEWEWYEAMCFIMANRASA